MENIDKLIETPVNVSLCKDIPKLIDSNFGNFGKAESELLASNISETLQLELLTLKKNLKNATGKSTVLKDLELQIANLENKFHQMNEAKNSNKTHRRRFKEIANEYENNFGMKIEVSEVAKNDFFILTVTYSNGRFVKYNIDKVKHRVTSFDARNFLSEAQQNKLSELFGNTRDVFKLTNTLNKLAADMNV